MLFLIHCLDRPGGAALRAATYDAHRAWLRGADVDLKLSGPILGEDGEARIGSVFILEAPDRAAAEAFHRADPFARAGLFDRVTISPFLDVTRGRPAFGSEPP